METTSRIDDVVFEIGDTWFLIDNPQWLAIIVGDKILFSDGIYRIPCITRNMVTPVQSGYDVSRVDIYQFLNTYKKLKSAASSSLSSFDDASVPPRTEGKEKNLFTSSPKHNVSSLPYPNGPLCDAKFCHHGITEDVPKGNIPKGITDVIGYRAYQPPQFYTVLQHHYRIATNIECINTCNIQNAITVDGVVWIKR